MLVTYNWTRLRPQPVTLVFQLQELALCREPFEVAARKLFAHPREFGVDDLQSVEELAFGNNAVGVDGTQRHEVTVRAGETLSQIAAREMPGVRNDQAVVAIEHESNLGSSQVQAGQKVIIPAP